MRAAIAFVALMAGLASCRDVDVDLGARDAAAGMDAGSESDAAPDTSGPSDLDAGDDGDTAGEAGAEAGPPEAGPLDAGAEAGGADRPPAMDAARDQGSGAAPDQGGLRS